MTGILKVLNNERIKHFYGLKTIDGVISINVFQSGFAVVAYKFRDSAALAAGSFYLAFLRGALNGILLKPLVPILLIVMTVSVVSEDYTHGCMKFFLISRITRQQLLSAKIIFLMLGAFALMVMAFLFTWGTGYLLFRDINSIFDEAFFNILRAYLCSGFLTFPLIGLITVISLVTSSTQSALGISLGAYIALSVADSYLPVIFFKPYSGLEFLQYFFLEQFYSEGLRLIAGAVLYSLVLFILAIVHFKRKDMVL